MKRPIEVADIRRGDLIRAERGDHANEWRVGINWTAPVEPPDVDYYLLDRPRVVLHPAGTRLRLTRNFYPWNKGEEIELSRDWYEDDAAGCVDSGHLLMKVDPDAVVVVQPTVAVPVSALDELRRDYRSRFHATFGSGGVVIPAHVLDRFLRAVDANEATA